jgi:hypothetical protein
MKTLLAQNGAVGPLIEYLGKIDGHWVAIPATPGSQIKGPCGRIDLFKQHAGIDLQKMYPAGAEPDKALSEAWTWDAFLAAAEKCHKAGFPFGIGLGGTADSVDSIGALFGAYGAELVDAKGNVTVKSDAVKQVLEYARSWCRSCRPIFQHGDDASNNKWLIRRQGCADHESAERLGGGEARQSAGGRAAVDVPCAARTERPHPAVSPVLLGDLKFSKNKPAAKSLMLHLSERSAVEKLVAASQATTSRRSRSSTTSRTWADEGPPKGTLYHYPPKPRTDPARCPDIPAPPKIAVQIYNQAVMTKMVVKVTTGGESIDKAIGWAASELEGFMRT